MFYFIYVLRPVKVFQAEVTEVKWKGTAGLICLEYMQNGQKNYVKTHSFPVGFSLSPPYHIVILWLPHTPQGCKMSNKLLNLIVKKIGSSVQM